MLNMIGHAIFMLAATALAAQPRAPLVQPSFEMFMVRSLCTLLRIIMLLCNIVQISTIVAFQPYQNMYHIKKGIHPGIYPAEYVRLTNT